MKHKIGDTVILKNTLLDGHDYNGTFFYDEMKNIKSFTIEEVYEDTQSYKTVEGYAICDEMIQEIPTHIIDSGGRRTFGSGAVRDVQEGKGRADLLPLKQCAEWSEHRELAYIQKFIDTRDKKWIYSAMTEFVNQSGSGYEEMDFDEVLLDVSKHYEEGAKKYAERNWEKGIPLHAYIDSGVRHFLKCMAGWDDEPHNRAFIWNMLGAIWTLENRPECDDLPGADTTLRKKRKKL